MTGAGRQSQDGRQAAAGDERPQFPAFMAETVSGRLMTLSRPRSRKPFAAISRRFPASWPGRKTLASAAMR